jgi:hypothetical protein
MARPTNRYARAQARARYRKPKRSGSSLAWNVAIGVIVILGIGGIVVSRSSSSAGGAPELGDHWHARLAVNICGQFIGDAPEFEADPEGNRVGIHTHGDGFMHIHPFTSGETGDNATVGFFLSHDGVNGPFDISEDSFELWEGGPKENGDPCPDGRPGEVRWAVNGEEQDGNPGDYKPEDGDVVVIAFLPAGDEIPPPPEATQTQD